MKDRRKDTPTSERAADLTDVVRDSRAVIHPRRVEPGGMSVDEEGAIEFDDRVEETSTTTGTGSLPLAGAPSGNRTFQSALVTTAVTC